MTAVIVSDAGPLIALSRIDQLGLLQQRYGTLVSPEPVLEERRIHSGRPGARRLATAIADGWIQTRSLAAGGDIEVERLRLVPDLGEARAIVLAEQLQCRFLLIDERRGRAIAKRRGIPVVGLAGVLLIAKRAGQVASVQPLLDALAIEGYRLSAALAAEVLRLAEESASKRG
ncbi:DUF3368 domain-containing protein [Thiorhodococcus mannitoliphagus]|uniref:DUF3368 domain-containing protein n=1 Tax=Thiorhodococcus mannitoliphagus TaxID=329406 RepID=A0A6P1E2U4_9GAMM|nr:DUF3368 domain-containing protein [Thiorhodococcus mannitoliphagus]NEX22812.1 DUF3368 domain-containing protein [Thiorhodococcus mannitoliphagus]